MFSLDFIFWLLHNFDAFRYQFWPHCGHFGGSWGTTLMIFRCIGDTLKFQWISWSPQGHPKLREWGQWVVNWCSRGYYYHHQIAYLQDINLQIPSLLMEDCKELEVVYSKGLASQPGGPWQAGAGGLLFSNTQLACWYWVKGFPVASACMTLRRSLMPRIDDDTAIRKYLKVCTGHSMSPGPK